MLGRGGEPVAPSPSRRCTGGVVADCGGNVGVHETHRSAVLGRFGVSRGLVVDCDRKLVGLVTLRDMVLAYVHQDEGGVEA